VFRLNREYHLRFPGFPDSPFGKPCSPGGSPGAPRPDQRYSREPRGPGSSSWTTSDRRESPRSIAWAISSATVRTRANCIDLVMANCSITLLGNHDRGRCSTRRIQHRRRARHLLDPEQLEAPRPSQQREALGVPRRAPPELPPRTVPVRPRLAPQPVEQYIFPRISTPPQDGAAVPTGRTLLFSGHTHVPACSPKVSSSMRRRRSTTNTRWVRAGAGQRRVGRPTARR